ncbi:MAG: enoyl-CoA hydratase/isomerase family protein [Bacteroidia bacterium]|nr:enoyl-CoA hydratase/isomerase family protein [Bacteroidia bacterium]
MNTLSAIKKKGYDILQLNRGRSNPINHEMVREIRAYLKEKLTDESTRGVILNGNTDGFFSVGLDLKELFYFDEKQIVSFWEDWDAMVYELAMFPKPMIAAINGYSPAGGCVLAITCDYRIMSAGEKFLIGLNETAVGIVMPEYIYQLAAFWMGKRQAYHNLLRGKLLSVEEAKAQHLIDEVCEMEEVLPRAEKEMQKLLRSPDNLLINSKANMKKELWDRLNGIEQAAVELKLKAWFDPKSRAVMQMIVQQLEKK